MAQSSLVKAVRRGCPCAVVPDSGEWLNKVEGSNRPVILSEAKDHLATLDHLKMILRFAQDDTRPILPYSRVHVWRIRM